MSDSIYCQKPVLKELPNGLKVPIWFNPYGLEMRISPEHSFIPEIGSTNRDGYRSLVFITRDLEYLKSVGLSVISAFLRVGRKFFMNDYHWVLEWFINYGAFFSEGRIEIVSQRDLLNAFSHQPCVMSDKPSRQLISRFGGEAARIGIYIRWKNFLNIPGPGTGNDRDPNISIFVTEEVEKAVVDLIVFPDDFI